MAWLKARDPEEPLHYDDFPYRRDNSERLYDLGKSITVTMDGPIRLVVLVGTVAP